MKQHVFMTGKFLKDLQIQFTIFWESQSMKIFAENSLSRNFLEDLVLLLALKTKINQKVREITTISTKLFFERAV